VKAIADLIPHLAERACRIELDREGVAIVGQTDRLTAELVAEVRRLKPALVVELLREQARNLVAFIDGDAPLAERQAKLSELLAVEDRLSAAQKALWDSWHDAGFKIIWSPIVEEFILVGDGSPPPGGQGIVVYTWAEVEALKDAAPEHVIAAHKLKKEFNGTVHQPERTRAR
jgi:hypothetical protein